MRQKHSVNRFDLCKIGFSAGEDSPVGVACARDELLQARLEERVGVDGRGGRGGGGGGWGWRWWWQRRVRRDDVELLVV